MVSFPDNPLVSVGGYMRSDNLQLPCVQPPTSSYNFQLPHGGHGGHVCHDGRGKHGGRGEHGGHGGQDRDRDGTGRDGTGQN